MIYELNHFGIVIKNLEKSLAFYQDVLGGKVVYQGFIPGNKTDIVYLNVGGGLIEFLHRADPGPDEKFGINHIAFMSDDLDNDYARLTDAGYEGLLAPKVAGTGVGRLSFVADPNGVRVEILQRDVKMREDEITHPVIKSFDHFSITAKELDKALGFYEVLFGMKQLKKIEGKAQYLTYDFDVLELVAGSDDEPDFNHFALRVDDVAAAIAGFAAQGVAVDAAGAQPDGAGQGLSGIIYDPDGVKIKLVDRPDLHA